MKEARLGCGFAQRRPLQRSVLGKFGRSGVWDGHGGRVRTEAGEAGAEMTYDSCPMLGYSG